MTFKPNQENMNERCVSNFIVPTINDEVYEMAYQFQGEGDEGENQFDEQVKNNEEFLSLFHQNIAHNNKKEPSASNSLFKQVKMIQASEHTFRKEGFEQVGNLQDARISQEIVKKSLIQRPKISNVSASDKVSKRELSLSKEYSQNEMLLESSQQYNICINGSKEGNHSQQLTTNQEDSTFKVLQMGSFLPLKKIESEVATIIGQGNFASLTKRQDEDMHSGFKSGREDNKNFEGFETPKSNRPDNKLLNNEDEDRKDSISEINIENQNVEGVDSGSDGNKKSFQNTHSLPKGQKQQSCMGEVVTKYDSRSLFIFKQEWCIRQLCIKTVDSRVFEYLMVVIIILNSVTLSMYDYSDRDSTNHYNQVLDVINFAFTIIFIVEAALKILSKGLIFHQQSYLRIGWNLIDAIVVVSGILELSFGSVKLKSLRVVRVFRPLKTINVIPGMKKLISALIGSLPDFANVGIFLIYVLILFATLGCHQYNGALYNTCRYNEKPENITNWAYDTSFGRVCSQSGNGNFICPNNMTCGNHDQYPTIDWSSEKIGQRAYLNYGILNYDNVGSALLTVYQIINSDTWYQEIINLMDIDIPIFGAIFIVCMIIVGQFFLMNLILAVIIFSFIKAQKIDLEQEIRSLNDQDMKIEGIKGSENVNSMSDIAEDLESEYNESENSQHKIKQPVEIIGESPDGFSSLAKMATKRPSRLPKHSESIGKRNTQNIVSNSKGKKSSHNHQGNVSDFLRPQAQKRKVANMFQIIQKDSTKQVANGLADLFNTQSPENKLNASSKNNEPIDEERSQFEESKNNQREIQNEGNLNLFAYNPPEFQSPITQQILSPEDIVLIPINDNNFLDPSSTKKIFQNDKNSSSKISNRHRSSNSLAPKDEGKQDSSQNIGRQNQDSVSNNSKNTRRGMRTPNSRSSQLIISQIIQQTNILEGSNNPVLAINKRLINMPEIQENVAALQKQEQMLRLSLLSSVKMTISPSPNLQGQDPNPESKDAILADSFTIQDPSNQNSDVLSTFKFGPNNKVASLFKKYIKKKIEQEYEIYFKTMLKEAKDSYKGAKHEQYAQQSNIRELVGLRVGLEFIKSNKVMQQQQEIQNIIENRYSSNKCYKFAYRLTEQSYFEIFMALCIIVNTIILALDKYPINLDQTLVLEKLNIVFTIIFTFEMLIKIMALGLKNYFKGTMFNLFDCGVVIASIVDIFLSNLLVNDQTESSGSVITALRGFRLLRIFKLAKSWKRFEILIETLGRTLADIAIFSILLFLVIFTFTLLGLELFAWKAKFNIAKDILDDNGVSPRYNFDNFLNSFTTVFIILTNDGMSTIFMNFYRAVGAVQSIIFFILLGIIGQKILLNLFIAILLENFDEGVLKQKMHEYEQQQQEKTRSNSQGLVELTIMDRLKKVWKNIGQRLDDWLNPKQIEEQDFEFENQNTNQLQQSISINPALDQDKQNLVLQKLQMLNIEKKRQRQMLKKKQSTKFGIVNKDPELEGIALGMLTQTNKFRKFIFNVVTNKYFDYFIIVTIVLSAVQLALDSPVSNPKSALKKALFWVDVITTVIFILEAIMKTLSFGFLLNGYWSYIRQPWNILDFVVIIFSVMSIGPFSDNFKTIKIFRILRSMRLISRNDQLKVAVRALFYAIPNILNITIIMLLFFLIFGVISVSYFKGKFYYCTNYYEELFPQIKSMWDCHNTGGLWINNFYNFDDALSALLTLFVSATTAGWSEIMMDCATASDMNYIAVPDSEANPVWIFFFIFFVIVGSFFFLNLFVGVVISTFHSEHDKIGGNNLLTEKQKEWIDLRLLVLRSEPLRKLKQPQSKIRAYFFRIYDSKIFKNFILILIIANCLVLLFKWYEQNKKIDQVGEYLNYVFTAIFSIEALIAMIAVEPRLYFSDSWNIFDLIIIIGSVASIFISANTSLAIKGVITILRSFRILRLLRLIKRGNSLRLIFNTFVITLHSLANIGGLLLLFIFMYSILGMIVFGQVKRNDPMNSYINFENFYNSYMTLFVVATGDSWDKIMQAFAIENTPSTPCLDNPSYEDMLKFGNGNTIGCGSRTLAYSYFISYMFVVNLIFLKIFIAIILEGYNDTQTQDGRLFNYDMSEKFRDVWTEFDPDATTFIQMKDLRQFLFALGEPLGFGQSFKGRKFLQDQFIASLELPTYQEFTSYQFLDILDALSFRLMVIDHIHKFNHECTLMNSNSQPQRQRTLPANLQVNKEQEQDIRTELQKEINKLIFQKKSENIMAVKEVSEKEVKRIKLKDQSRDKNGLTSQHHMAAEATIRRMKAFIRQKKRARGIEVPSDSDSYSRVSQSTVRRPAQKDSSGSIANFNPLGGAIKPHLKSIMEEGDEHESQHSKQSRVDKAEAKVGLEENKSVSSQSFKMSGPLKIQSYLRQTINLSDGGNYKDIISNHSGALNKLQDSLEKQIRQNYAGNGSHKTMVSKLKSRGINEEQEIIDVPAQNTFQDRQNQEMSPMFALQENQKDKNCIQNKGVK